MISAGTKEYYSANKKKCHHLNEYQTMMLIFKKIHTVWLHSYEIPKVCKRYRVWADYWLSSGKEEIESDYFMDSGNLKGEAVHHCERDKCHQTVCFKMASEC